MRTNDINPPQGAGQVGASNLDAWASQGVAVGNRAPDTSVSGSAPQSPRTTDPAGGGTTGGANMDKGEKNGLAGTGRNTSLQCMSSEELNASRGKGRQPGVGTSGC